MNNNEFYFVDFERGYFLVKEGNSNIVMGKFSKKCDAYQYIRECL